MRTVIDYLLFRRMLAPFLLQLLFWAGIGGTAYGAWILFDRGHWAWWVALLFGCLVTRLMFEFGLIAFRSYEVLRDIRARLDSGTST